MHSLHRATGLFAINLLLSDLGHLCLWKHFPQYLSWQKPTLLQLSYPLLCIHSVFVFMALASSLSTRHPTEPSEYRRCVEALLTVPGELEIQQYYEKVVLACMPTVLYKQANK